jgi:hypothetical protein
MKKINNSVEGGVIFVVLIGAQHLDSLSGATMGVASGTNFLKILVLSVLIVTVNFSKITFFNRTPVLGYGDASTRLFFPVKLVF